MRDPTISDILVNGPKCVYVERRGRLSRSDVVFNDEKHLIEIVRRIVSRVGRRVDETSPLCDARLPDGSRVNAVIPPLALDGTLLSIRRSSKTPLQFKDLVEKKAITPEMVDFLAACHPGAGEHGGLGRHRLGQDDADERPLVVHPRGRAGGDDRGRRRAAAPAAARRPDGDPAGEHRGQRRDHDPRPGQERPADAARPDHRRRVPGRRDARHAPGDEHRPRRLDDHDPRQRHPRRDRPYGDDGRHGRLRPADLDHPPPDRLGRADRSSRRPGSPAASARSSRSPRSSAWRRTSSACRTSSSSSRPASTRTAWRRATTTAPGSGRSAWRRWSRPARSCRPSCSSGGS